MSNYIIGDIHGCFKELKKILSKVQFNPGKDTLWLTGDLVFRGPESIKVLQLIKNLDDKVRMVLGNHDLNLLSAYYGNYKIKYNKEQKNIISFLRHPDYNLLMDWYRHQPIIQKDEDKKLIMVHAGILPSWNINNVCKYANEVESIIKSNNCSKFFNNMYCKTTNIWNNKLNELSRINFIIKVFTQIRYCFANGSLAMKYKNIPIKTPKKLIPWFNMNKYIINNYKIVFGHWSALMGKYTPKNIYGLDTGCCWGGKLTLLDWESKELIYIKSSLSQF